MKPRHRTQSQFNDDDRIGKGMQDTLSPILNMLGVKGAIYFQTDFFAPWGMAISDTGHAQFHLVVSGEAVLREQDGSLDWLSSGDLVVYPTGASHTISDSADSPAHLGQDVVGAVLKGQSIFADGGQRTRLICGHFSYDLSHRHPLVSELPDRLILRSSEIFGFETLVSLLRLIIRETDQPEIGSDTIVQRLSDAVFVAILRAHITQAKPDRGFLAALSDPRIAQCISEIHDAFPETPSLDTLAKAAGMSRTALALVFKRHLGFGPGEYATRWKLLNAARMLVQGDESIEAVAFACGYQSPSSFSRAFRAFFGQSASEYRDMRRPAERRHRTLVD